MPNVAKETQPNIVGNDAFPLTMQKMKTNRHQHLQKTKQIFTYRPSRACRVVENVTWIFVYRRRVISPTIKLSTDKGIFIILATCCVHNFMVEKNKSKICIEVADLENINNTVARGM